MTVATASRAAPATASAQVRPERVRTGPGALRRAAQQPVRQVQRQRSAALFAVAAASRRCDQPGDDLGEPKPASLERRWEPALSLVISLPIPLAQLFGGGGDGGGQGGGDGGDGGHGDWGPSLPQLAAADDYEDDDFEDEDEAEDAEGDAQAKDVRAAVC